MISIPRPFSIGLLPALLVAPALGSVFVVDDGGGVGVDFTNIAPAIAAAQPSDVILVRPGTYTGFVLDKGLAVLGSGGVTVNGFVTIQNVPMGPRASVCGMQAYGLRVVSCAASVVVIDLDVHVGYFEFQAGVNIQGSSDVRLRALDVGPAGGAALGMCGMIVQDARVELTDSSLVGWAGAAGHLFTSGSPGGAGLLVRSGGDVHVSVSSMRGGKGGDYSDDESGTASGGDGGSGILVHPSGRVLVTGRAADLVIGGNCGVGWTTGLDGTPGAGLHTLAAGTSRHSEVTFQGGLPAPDVSTTPVAPFAGPGQRIEAVPIDASLRASGTLVPGTSATFTVRGAFGDSARLRLGRQLALVDLGDVYEERLLVPLRTYDLGTLPASGEATFTFPLPSSLPPGFLIVAQASVTSALGETRLSQSVPIVLR